MDQDRYNALYNRFMAQNSIPNYAHPLNDEEAVELERLLTEQVQALRLDAATAGQRASKKGSGTSKPKQPKAPPIAASSLSLLLERMKQNKGATQ